jgi:membrane protein implicated in regulation of membrane protease activity
MLLLLCVEAATMGLTTIWFALGALMALMVSAFAPWQVQLSVFVVVSALTLWLVRPMARRMLTKRERTNADRVIGQVGIVSETVDNVAGTGVVQVGGRTWTARSHTGRAVPVGAYVRVCRIEGVKVMVEEARPAGRAAEDKEVNG